jgi:Mrp family chromosome partitioning ATPase
VILVVESGKTRRQVALTAKRKLEGAGGKILGVVLNKRRYYIPEFVYKRL